MEQPEGRLRRAHFLLDLLNRTSPGFGSAEVWPVAARAQQGDRVRRVGVLTSGDENDLVRKTFISTFTQALADLGWTDGRNARMDLRWGRGDEDRMRALAQELAGLQPDIILTGGTRRPLPSSRRRGRSRLTFPDALLRRFVGGI
jgi:hypothetical protein